MVLDGVRWCWKVNAVRFSPLCHCIRVLDGVRWYWKVNSKIFPTASLCYHVTTLSHHSLHHHITVSLHHHITMLLHHCITTSPCQGAGWCWKVNAVRFSPLNQCVTTLPHYCVTMSGCWIVSDGAGKLMW